MPDSLLEPRTFTHTRFELRPRAGGPPVHGDVRYLSGTKPRTAVVLCHGFKGFKDWGFFPGLARAIAAHGHAAVSFNLSRSGVGADGVDFSALPLFAEQTHTRNVAEIRHVIDELYHGKLLPRSPQALGLFGHSRGGGEAVLVAADDARVGALATWAAIARVRRWSPEQEAAWERGETVEIANSRTGQQMPVGPAYWTDLKENAAKLDITAAASRVTVPWLIVHGDADTSVELGDAQALFDAAGDEAEMLTLDGADHTFGAVHPYAGPTDALRAAAQSTLEWFDDYLDPGASA
jgi:dienelactone hydrolase